MKMDITDKELSELAEKAACEMWGHFSTGEIHRAYFIDAYTKGFREALKQVKNNGVLDDVNVCSLTSTEKRLAANDWTKSRSVGDRQQDRDTYYDFYSGLEKAQELIGNKR